MTRLYDRLHDDLITEDLQSEILGGGKYKPVVFEITNVADYYRAHSDSHEDLSHFPNVAPPFGCYWMEWRQASSGLLPADRVGVLILGTDGAGDPMPNDARWSIALIVFIQGRGGRAVRLADWVLLVDEDGHIDLHREDISDAWIDLAFPRPRPAETKGHSDEEMAELRAKVGGDMNVARAMIAELEEESRLARLRAAEIEKEAREVATPMLRRLVVHPVLLAHSLMACKNVEYEDHAPPARLSRKHERKRGAPLVTFRTLLIRPVGGGRQSTGRVDIGDGATAFHIVRGHFKTYTAERPLFGKRTGTYWWSPMTRGDREHGEIIKDYRMDSIIPAQAPQ